MSDEYELIVNKEAVQIFYNKKPIELSSIPENIRSRLEGVIMVEQRALSEDPRWGPGKHTFLRDGRKDYK